MIARTPNIKKLIQASKPGRRFLGTRRPGEFVPLIVGPLGIIGNFEAKR